MQKLTYERVGDSVLKVDLKNGYEVIASYLSNKERSRYTVSLSLKHKDVNLLDLMDNENDSFAALEFEDTYKTICPSILKQVSTLLFKGRLQYYIDRYEYMLQCFDKGNEILSNEGRGDS